MTALTLIIIGLAALLFVLDVLVGSPYPCPKVGRDDYQDCLPSRRASTREFFGRELPFVYLFIGLPLLIASPGDGALILALGFLSFVSGYLIKRAPQAH